MYTPAAFAQVDDDVVLGLLRASGFGHLVTGGSDTQLVSTPIPFIVDDQMSEVQAHLARANDHWRTLDSAAVLLVVPVSDMYVSPRWYPSKLEHGKVVPTWNYEVVHVHATVDVIHDPAWLRMMLDRLTAQNEGNVSAVDGGPEWEVGDAPADFIAKQLSGIVGLRLNITSVQAKQKLSQNKTDPDRLAVVERYER